LTFTVEIMLRQQERVHSETLSHDLEPALWQEDDAAQVLTSILEAIDRLQHPADAEPRPVSLRGLSWIVSPHGDGVVIALEIHSASAVAGPFQVPQETLHALVSRALAGAKTSDTVH
jgi:hypothetical protein